MKSILISIKPEWVAKILNGEKTIEIRKTMPKCDLPIDVYIYCTKGNKKDWHLMESVGFDDTGWQCWKGYEYDYYIGSKGYLDWCLEGKVVAKFTLNKSELFHYIGDFRKEPFYAWHIDNLVIFDKPKELNEFKRWCDDNFDPWKNKCLDCKAYRCDILAGEHWCDKSRRYLTKAPQNYVFIETEELK